jgi:hypothetical protein
VDVITPEDLGGDEDLARRVLTYARTIAPIDDVVDVDLKKDAIAVLRSISGPRQVSAERAGGISVSYFQMASWFSAEDRASLRSICQLPASDAHMPVGSFPLPSRVLHNLWPEHPST